MKKVHISERQRKRGRGEKERERQSGGKEWREEKEEEKDAEKYEKYERNMRRKKRNTFFILYFAVYLSDGCVRLNLQSTCFPS